MSRFARMSITNSIVALILVISWVHFSLSHPYWFAGCLIIVTALLSRSLFGLLVEEESSYIGSAVEDWLAGARFPPYEIQSLDDYIRRERNEMLFVGLAGFIIILAAGIYFFHRSPRFMIFMLLLLLVIYALYQLLTFKKRLGERAWLVSCHECTKVFGYSKFISLFEWKCPGCGEVHLDRHMIEGCFKCGTKYGTGERDINTIICDECGSPFSFFSSFEFKYWDVLAKGESLGEEVILVERFRFIRLIAAGCFLWAIFNLLFGAYTLVFFGKYMEKNHGAVAWSLGIGLALLLFEGWLLPMFLRLIKYPPMRTKIKIRRGARYEA